MNLCENWSRGLSRWHNSRESQPAGQDTIAHEDIPRTECRGSNQLQVELFVDAFKKAFALAENDGIYHDPQLIYEAHLQE